MEIIRFCSIELVCNRNEPDMMGEKVLFNVISGINGISAKPGKVFYNHTVNVPSLNIGEHLLKTWSVKVRTGQSVVNIGVIYYKFRLIRQEIIQHQLLIFYGTSTLLLSSTDRRIYNATEICNVGSGTAMTGFFLLFLAI